MQKLEGERPLWLGHGQLYLQHIKGKTGSAGVEEKEWAPASLSAALLLDFILGWLTQCREGNDLCSHSDSVWATHFSGHFDYDSDERERECVLLVITCFVFLHIKKRWIKTLFLLNSRQFQIEAYFNHREEQTRSPDPWPYLFIIRYFLTMAMWWSGWPPGTTHFPLASRK